MATFQNALDESILSHRNTLEKEVSQLISKRHLSLGIVETFTMGTLTSAFAALPNASDFFRGSLICQHPLSFTQLANIPAHVLNSRDKSVLLNALLQAIANKLKTNLNIAIIGSTQETSTPNVQETTFYFGIKMNDISKTKNVSFSASRQELYTKIGHVCMNFIKPILAHANELFKTE